MSKYNLHQLGWKAFETLCGHIMQELMGNTYSLYTDGKDGGKDGFFEGSGKLNKMEDSLSGRFVFQCKHSSIENKPLTMSMVKDEIPKLNSLVKNLSINHYVIFTNCKLSTSNEEQIKKEFLKMTGVKTCTLLGQEWFEATIDKNKILRKLVPRIYGIGDLSEILDERIYKQSLEVLEDLKETVSTFVPTTSYQKAIDAILKKRFVILLGPPASGKSAIATNICMTSIVEDESTDTLILENFEEFKKHYNPDNPKKLYWFDDVFGATNLDFSLLNGWIKVFSKLQTAIKNGATVIFTSRDYIFKDAISKIQKDKFPLLFDSQVIIDVNKLNMKEKEQILYNHIKNGDIQKSNKTNLKPFLSNLTKHNNFSPELARRLGNSFFHNNLRINEENLNNFFSNPSEFFKGIIEVLDDDKKAALTLILLHGNKLPSPVSSEHLKSYLLESYDVNLPQIKDALEVMKDSLVKLNFITNERYWLFYHPSMIDSIQSMLSEKVEMLELYLIGSTFETLIRDATCLEYKKNKVYIPKHLWSEFCERLVEGVVSKKSLVKEAAIRFICNETPDEFLEYFTDKFVGIDMLVTPYLSQFSFTSVFKLAARFKKLCLLDNRIEEKIRDKIYEIASYTCDMTFSEDESIILIIGEEGLDEIFNKLKLDGPDHVYSEFEFILQNIDEDALEPEENLKEWFNSIDILIEELERRNNLDENEKNEYSKVIHKAQEEFDNFMQNREEELDDFDEDIKYNTYSMASTERDNMIDIFSDVDM